MSFELKEHYQKIYTFCYFKVKNRDLAEDITQETFLKFFETTQYLEKGKKLPFLYTIARNCCKDYFRRARQTADLDCLPESAAETSDSLVTAIAVRAAVAELSVEEQEIVLLRFASELSIRTKSRRKAAEGCLERGGF